MKCFTFKNHLVPGLFGSRFKILHISIFFFYLWNQSHSKTVVDSVKYIWCVCCVCVYCESVKIVDLATTLKLFYDMQKELPCSQCVAVQQKIPPRFCLLLLVFQCGFSFDLLTVLAWQHFTYLIFQTVSLCLLTSGIKETTPSLTCFTRGRLPLVTDPITQIKEQGLVQHWDWEHS